VFWRQYEAFEGLASIFLVKNKPKEKAAEVDNRHIPYLTWLLI
jgi:hypothetical protein